MIPYIKVNKLNIGTPDSEISLTVDKGEIIGITGLNGCGKSTFASYLVGMRKPDSIGKILIDGLDPFSDLDNRKIRRMVGMVFQDPRKGFVFENIGRDTVFGSENLGIPVDKIKTRANRFIKAFGLSSKKSKSFNNISASEGQRAAVCAAMMMRYDILILDEPFSMQGDAGRRYVDAIVKNARRIGQTVIVFTKKKQYLSLLDKSYELSGGRLYEIDINGMPQNISNESETAVPLTSQISVERYIQGDDDKSEAGISLHNVYFGYNDKLIVEDANARFLSGSAYRIIGPPASGKSTYLQIIGGLLTPQEGEIFVSDNSRIGYVFQAVEDGFVENTVLDDVMFGPMSAGNSKKKSRDMAISILKFVGVSEKLWNRSPLELSMGEQRLVSIAGALALNPDFLLIDEPYLGLDVEYTNQLKDIISALCYEGKCVITVEG